MQAAPCSTPEADTIFHGIAVADCLHWVHVGWSMPQ